MQSFSQTLAYYLSPSVVRIFFLGFVSGLPFLLLLSTFSAWLIEAGVSKTYIGLLAFVTLPYAFKFVWAPYLEKYAIPYLGRILGHRKSWLMTSQFMLFIGLIGMGFSTPISQLWLTVVLALWVGFWSATQDILIEVHRIEALSPKHLGAGASASVIGYRMGMLTSGAGALYLAERLPWCWVYTVMACCMCLGMVIVLCTPESSGHHTLGSRTSLKNIFIEPLKSFFSHQHVWLICIFLMSFKALDTILNTMSIPFLMELGFSKAEIAYVAKSFGIFNMIVGGFVGGILLSRWGLHQSLLFCTLMQIFACVLFYVQAIKGHDLIWLFLTMGIENFTCGMSQVALIGYFTILCVKPFCGTHFALLTSISSLDRVVISALAGWLADQLIWTQFYTITALLSFPALFFLLKHMGHFSQVPKKYSSVQYSAASEEKTT